MDTNWEYRRGDIYLANLNPVKGHEQGGTRPVLVISNNNANHYSPLLTIVPLTSKEETGWFPTHVRLPNSIKALEGKTVILIESINTIDKERVIDYLGKINLKQMAAVEVAVIIQVALTSRRITERRDKAVELLNKHNKKKNGKHSSASRKHSKA